MRNVTSNRSWFPVFSFFFSASFFSWWLISEHFSCRRNRRLYFLNPLALKLEVSLGISPLRNLVSTTNQEMGGLDDFAGDRHIPLEHFITFFHIGAELGIVVESC